ncbi:MAG: UDP-N-acetylglucosamine 1-carboxyvinyltransferase [Patescibacteria group bacterium]|nr:UDP-N-acetylglucosamine 1-carboxyvinyltransferase [Patescibacteria group bacterium]
MEKLIVTGGKKLRGTVRVSGAKNVALKALVAACLTDEAVIINNVPLISDLFVNIEIIKELGGEVKITDHTVSVCLKQIKTNKILLETAARIRTSSMFLVPLLSRTGKAIVPNPGGCRIGARPIDRTIKGLRKMGASIVYNSSDGYFYSKFNKSSVQRLKGMEYSFEKNTHTGTETLILAGVLALGKTVLKNAAEEPEVDELIKLLNQMGAKITRVNPREIVIEGVEKLHGTTFSIGPDRNEIVTFGVAAVLTGGDITVENADIPYLSDFINMLEKAGGGVEYKDQTIRFYAKKAIYPTDIATSSYPGFMTDWQAPWAILMTQAKGKSTIHETVYENRFGYVSELRKMGAHIDFFNPIVKNPRKFYNFNLEDNKIDYFHAVKIFGPSNLHNAVIEISDLRAGATLVLGALCASGTSIIFGVEHLDRGYENFDKRLNKLGAQIERVIE